MAKYLISFFLIALVACCSPAQGSGSQIELNGRTDGNIRELLLTHDTVRISYGKGGYVDGMWETIRFLASHPRKRVIIDGECVSACTLLINQAVLARSVCYTSRAKFTFHSSFYTVERDANDNDDDDVIKSNDKVDVRIMDPIYNRQMLHSFNLGIRKWIVAHNGYAAIDTYQTMSYSEAVRLRDMRCK